MLRSRVVRSPARRHLPNEFATATVVFRTSFPPPSRLLPGEFASRAVIVCWTSFAEFGLSPRVLDVANFKTETANFERLMRSRSCLALSNLLEWLVHFREFQSQLQKNQNNSGNKAGEWN